MTLENSRQNEQEPLLTEEYFMLAFSLLTICKLQTKELSSFSSSPKNKQNILFFFTFGNEKGSEAFLEK